MLNPNLDPGFFNNIFVFPILNLLMFFNKIFNLIKIPGAFGLAIIAVTTLIRLIFQPFFKQQMETSRKMNEIKPQLDRLNERYKNDQKTLQQEQMKIYQQAGINPAAGCLVMLLQLPLFYALYNTLSLFLVTTNIGQTITQVNKVLYHPFLHVNSIDTWFFGLNLAKTPAQANVWFYYLIPVITAVLQYLQTQSMTQMQSKNDDKKIEKADDKKNSTDDFSKALNMQMKYIFPVLIGWFSFKLPVGMSLYWNIFSLFGITMNKQLKVKK